MENKKAISYITASLATLYLVGLLIGFSWTILPGISNALLSIDCSDLSSQQYGSLSLPLTLGAILASWGASQSGFRRYGMRTVLIYGVTFLFTAMAILFSTGFFPGHSTINYSLLLCVQCFLGLGIGSCLSSANVLIITTAPKSNAAFLIVFYACVGIGSAIQPLIMEGGVENCTWHYRILWICGALMLCMLLIHKYASKRNSQQPLTQELGIRVYQHLGKRFWAYLALGFLLGSVEEFFAVWGPIYVHQEGNWSITAASHGLALFWGAATIFRVLISIFSFFISPRFVYIFLPFVMLISFYLFSRVTNIPNIPIIFALAGIGCSAFFPLNVAFSEVEFNKFAAIVSGSLVGAYFIGGTVASLTLSIVHGWMDVKLQSLFQLMILVTFFMGLATIYLVKNTRVKT